MNSVPALQRGLELIKAAAGGDYTVAQLEEESGIPKASFNRLIKCLADNAFITINEDSRKLSLGNEAVYLAMESYENSALYQFGYPAVYDLGEIFKATFVIHQYCAPNRIYWRVKHAPPNCIRTRPVGFCMNFFNNNAQGQLFLSQMPKKEVKEYFASGELICGEYILNTYKKMKSRLEQIREQGFAFQERENHPGMKQIAVPLKFPGDNGVYSLTCYLPLDYQDVDKVRDRMLYEAARIAGVE